MGNHGSIKTKSKFRPYLLSFSTWNSKEMDDLYTRSHVNLADTFSLTRSEFEYLINLELVGYSHAKDLYDRVFCSGYTSIVTKNSHISKEKGLNSYFTILNRIVEKQNDIEATKNGIVDKFEVLCVIALASKLSDTSKIEYLFDIFNFNEKGYLLYDELTLLIMSIMNGVYKADKSLLTPSKKVCDVLTKHAMNYYCIIDSTKQTIRRAELVKFASETINVRSFLDAWRGHTSQVILAMNEYYRDYSFPATDTSISPSVDYTLLVGLPPSDFISWVRIDNLYDNTMDDLLIDNSIENSNDKIIFNQHCLFNHTTTITKTVQRHIHYHGLGLFGCGSLETGLLATKWLMNSIAILAAHPNLLMNNYYFTGQENSGRYCYQFYEGSSWRLIYIDDRIPCNIEKIPLFSKCSDSKEISILILEKCLAKYFHSYGKIGYCSYRCDSIEYGLRLLTGIYFHSKFHSNLNINFNIFTNFLF